MATQPATTANDDAVNALPASLDNLALDSESDSESIVVIKEEPSSPQGAVGGASAQPSMEDVLKRLKAAEERAKNAEDKTAALEAQLKQPAVGQPTGWAGLFAAIAEDARNKPLSQVSDKNFFKQLSSVFNPDSAYTFGDLVDGEAVSDSHQKQGAAAASSSAPDADRGPRNSDKSATDKVETELLKGLGKLKF